MKDAFSKLFLFDNSDFQKLNEKYEIIKKSVFISYEKDSLILSSETEDKGIFILLSGSAKIVSGSSGAKVVLRYLRAGDSFGAASLFDGTNIYSTSVISMDNCKIALLPKALILNLISDESTVAVNYLRYLSGRVSFLNRKISAFTAGSAEQKLAVYLSGLDFSNGAYTMNVTYTALASMLGIGRASLYRALDLFEREGIIRREGKQIFLTNDNALTKYI